MTFKFLLSYLSGAIFIWYLLNIHILANLSLLLNLSLSKYLIIGAILGAVSAIGLMLYFYAKNVLNILWVLIPVAILSLTFVYSLAVTHQIYDISFDGQAYHGEAINTMLEGWNPIHQPQSQGRNSYADSTDQYVFLDSYPKLAWYHSAIVHDLTGDYRDIKVLNLAILIPTLIFVFLALSRFEFSKDFFRNNAIRLLLTVLITINPITLVQATTVSIDGLVYSLLVILMSILVHIYLEYQNEIQNQFSLWLHFINLAAVYCVLSNVKTSGLVYASFFVGGFGFYLFLQKGWQIRNFLITFVISVVLAVCVFGFNPYITNSIYYKSPLYPVFNSKVDYYSINTPINIRDKNNIEVLVYSILSIGDMGDYINAKLPFVIYGTEMDALVHTQAKKAGFGPLFSGALVLSLISIVILIYEMYVAITQNKGDLKDRYRYFGKLALFVSILASLLASVIITKNSSSFRLVPQLWLLLVVPIIYSFTSHFQIARILGIITSAVVILNLIIIGGIYFGNQLKVSDIVTTKLHNLEKSGDYFKIYFGYSTGTRQLFRENNIYYQYSIDPANKCANTFKDFQFNQDSNVFVCTIPN